MKRRNIVIQDNIDFEFRRIIGKKTGYQKGAYSDAISEAIQMWIKKNSHSSLTSNSKTGKRSK